MNECFNCQKRHVGCHAECPDYAVTYAKADREKRLASYDTVRNYVADTGRRLAKISTKISGKR